MINKGILMSAYDVTISNARLAISADITPDYLRYFCLYWDEIMLVDAPPIRFEFNREKKLLHDAGLLSVRTVENPDWNESLGYIKWVGGGMYYEPSKDNGTDPMSKELARYVVNNHFQLASNEFGKLLKNEPNKWVIHQNGSKLILPENHKVEHLTARMELKNCLPVPKADIDLESILDFKINRSDELLALDNTLNELYLKITNSSDTFAAQDYYVKQLVNAISDLNIVSKENFGLCHFANRSVSLELSAASVIGAVSASALVEDPMLKLGSFLAGGVASSIKLSIGKTMEHKDAIGSHKLSYLSSVNKCGITAS